jgi:DNA-binding XRE family transcriptional regulator
MTVQINKKELSTRLLEFREKKGWTQSDLAEWLDLPLYTIQRWENEKVSISPVMFRLLKSKRVV